LKTGSGLAEVHAGLLAQPEGPRSRSARWRRVVPLEERRLPRRRGRIHGVVHVEVARVFAVGHGEKKPPAGASTRASSRIASVSPAPGTCSMAEMAVTRSKAASGKGASGDRDLGPERAAPPRRAARRSRSMTFGSSRPRSPGRRDGGPQQGEHARPRARVEEPEAGPGSRWR